MGCVAEALGAISGLAWGASSIFGGYALATGPVAAITTAAAAAATLNIVAGVAAAGAGVYILYHCAKPMELAPSQPNGVLPYNRFEVAY